MTKCWLFILHQVYINPPWCKTVTKIIYPQLFYSVVGDELPILTSYPPPDCLTQHWQKWLPDVKPAKYIGIDEGLKHDNVELITSGPFEGVACSQHSVDPDVLYRIHSKSAIPEIGVPCPRYMDRNNAEFPCVVKVDWSFIWDIFGRK